jgi:hypothetical protein
VLKWGATGDDYCRETSRNAFRKCFAETILDAERVEEDTVIVLDNAPYYRVREPSTKVWMPA